MLLMIGGLGAASLALLAICLYRQRQGGTPPPLLLALALACPAAAGWLGMDFSPSFTMMFAAAALLLTCLGEVLDRWPGAPQGVRWAGMAAFLAGVVLTFPGSYIYAAGDDYITQCTLGAAAAGLALAAWQQRGNPAALPMLGTWLSWICACFAVLCGLRSTALLPCGLGLCLLMAARWPKGRAGARRTLLFWAGTALVSAFPVAPMIF